MDKASKPLKYQCMWCAGPLHSTKWFNNRRYCSAKCSAAAKQDRYDNNLPLAEIRDDGITCLICNIHMSADHGHFTRIHGIPPSKQGRSVYLKALGLPGGSRLESKELNELNRANMNARLDQMANVRHRFEPGNKVSYAGKTGLKMSEKQLHAMRESGKNIASNQKFIEHMKCRSAKARVEKKCAKCGAQFVSLVGQNRRFCGHSCANSVNRRAKKRDEIHDVSNQACRRDQTGSQAAVRDR